MRTTTTSRWAIATTLLAVVLGPAAGRTRAAAPSGIVDPSFGDGGVVRTTYGRNQAYAAGLAIQGDGKILITGAAADPGAWWDDASQDLTVARLLPDGRPDPTFGDGGTASLGTARTAERGSSVALQPDGRIVVAGTAYQAAKPPHDGTGRGLLLRFDDAGRLDPTFGNHGKVVVAGARRVALACTVVTRSGNIVVSGMADRRRTGGRWFLARYLPDGSPDRSFGRQGRTLLPAGLTAFRFAEQRDGKLVVAAGEQLAIARLLDDGRLDDAFGAGGIARARAVRSGVSTDVALDDRDRIVATGFSGRLYVRTRMATARFLADGTLDRAFGRRGVVRTDPGSDEAEGGVALVAPTGRILVAGWMGTGRDAQTVTVLLAYRDDGSLDPDFGVGGITRKRFGRGDTTYALAFQDPSHLVASGWTWFWSSTAGSEAIVWRYLY